MLRGICLGTSVKRCVNESPITNFVETVLWLFYFVGPTTQELEERRRLINDQNLEYELSLLSDIAKVVLKIY